MRAMQVEIVDDICCYTESFINKHAPQKKPRCRVFIIPKGSLVTVSESPNGEFTLWHRGLTKIDKSVIGKTVKLYSEK